MSDKKDTPAPAQPAAPAPAKAGEVKAPAAPAKGGVWNVAKHFAYGGFAGMVATSCIQPIDMVKVRIQLLGEGGGAVGSKSPFAVAKHLIKTDGFLSLYKGLSAGLLRQATYSTARLGIWKAMTNKMTVPGQKSPFWQKAVIGLTAGGVGSVFGTPCDVALIRMQADATLPPEKRRNYKNVIDALVKIIKQEGFNGMFKGNVPVVIRAMSLNFGQLATYDEAMEQLRKYSKNDEVVKTGAKLISGFFASFCSLPFDFIKTRMQKQVKGPDGQYPYRNIVHATSKVFKQEGAFVFYRGFWTYYVRIAPHTMITLFVLEQIEQWEKRKAAATGAGKK